LEFWIGQKQPEAGMLIGMIIFFRVPNTRVSRETGTLMQ